MSSRNDTETVHGRPDVSFELGDERLRTFIGRFLIYASPVIAAVCALSLRQLVATGTVPIVSWPFILVVNLAIAVIGSAVGVAFLRGRLIVKILGSLAYGVLSVFIYMILFAAFVAAGFWKP